jgi:hypothetical protein
VALGARDPATAELAAKKLSGEGFVLYHAVDVSEDEKRRCKVRRESPAPKNLRLEPL